MTLCQKRMEEEASDNLKNAFLEVVDNQLRDNDPPETKHTFDRLVSDGFSEEDAKRHIGTAVCVEIWDIMTNRTEFNLERYKRNLENLPAEPSESD